MALLIEWGITLHNRMSLCLLVARVALAPSQRIPNCRTCLSYLTYLAHLTNLTYFNKTAPHRRVRRSTVPAVQNMAVLKTPLRELCATTTGAAIDGMPTW